LVKLGQRGAEWLLAEDVGARFDAGDRQGSVQRRRGADVNDIGFLLLQHLVGVGVPAFDAVLAAEGVEPVGIDVARGRELDAFGDVAQALYVGARDAPRADDDRFVPFLGRLHVAQNSFLNLQVIESSWWIY